MRGQLGFSVSFLEEMWSRNMANLMISPLRPGEFLAALMVMSVIRLSISLVPVTMLAILFFGFNLWGLGLGARRVLRQSAPHRLGGRHHRQRPHPQERPRRRGPRLDADVPGAAAVRGLLPGGDVCRISCRPCRWSLPPTYVFEGMRAIMFDHTFRADLMIEALAINVVYITVACIVFMRLVDSARRIGSLMAIGE